MTKDEELDRLDRLMAESWKPIGGFGGFYEVSNRGRVRSWKHKNGRRKKPYLLALSDSGKYYQVHLWHEDKRVVKSVHHLVLEAFIGSRPDGCQCAHRDGNAYNNNSENLRWLTPQENILEKHEHGTMPIGENSNSAKLTREQVLEIRDIKGWIPEMPYTRLAEDYGVVPSTIRRICIRETWKHLL